MFRKMRLLKDFKYYTQKFRNSRRFFDWCSGPLDNVTNILYLIEFSKGHWWLSDLKCEDCAFLQPSRAETFNHPTERLLPSETQKKINIIVVVLPDSCNQLDRL